MNIETYLITTGDPDGIGYEITAKALTRLPSKRNVRYLVYRSNRVESRYRKMLSKRTDVSEVVSDKSPAHWVREAAEVCLARKATALVTGPMSKSGERGAAVGHTEILKRVSNCSHVNMGFVGKKFNVVLATGHLPLREVSGALSEAVIERVVQNAARLAKALALSKKPLAVIGLNPHAGENGLIGDEESRLLAPALQSLRSRGLDVVGPLVPDAAFFQNNWKKYSVFVSLYHDQGLIPFKMVHGQQSGAQVSLGLPFVRTSVDHGTAKDIAGKNKADPSSMIDAIRLAMRLSKGGNHGL